MSALQLWRREDCRGADGFPDLSVSKHAKREVDESIGGELAPSRQLAGCQLRFDRANSSREVMRGQRERPATLSSAKRRGS